MKLQGNRSEFSAGDAEQVKSVKNSVAQGVPVDVNGVHYDDLIKLTTEDKNELKLAMGVSDGELGALISKAMAALAAEGLVDVSKITDKNILLTLLEKNSSKYLFEDHRQNGLIGINKSFLEIAANDKDAAKALFVAGIAHELRHEAGMDTESLRHDKLMLTKLIKEAGLTRAGIAETLRPFLPQDSELIFYLEFDINAIKINVPGPVDTVAGRYGFEAIDTDENTLGYVQIYKDSDKAGDYLEIDVIFTEAEYLYSGLGRKLFEEAVINYNYPEQIVRLRSSKIADADALEFWRAVVGDKYIVTVNGASFVKIDDINAFRADYLKRREMRQTAGTEVQNKRVNRIVGMGNGINELVSQLRSSFPFLAEYLSQPALDVMRLSIGSGSLANESPLDAEWTRILRRELEILKGKYYHELGVRNDAEIVFTILNRSILSAHKERCLLATMGIGNTTRRVAGRGEAEFIFFSPSAYFIDKIEKDGLPEGLNADEFFTLLARHEVFEFMALNKPRGTVEPNGVYALFSGYLGKMHISKRGGRKQENFHNYIRHLASQPPESLTELEKMLASQKLLLDYATSLPLPSIKESSGKLYDKAYIRSLITDKLKDNSISDYVLGKVMDALHEKGIEIVDILTHITKIEKLYSGEQSGEMSAPGLSEAAGFTDAGIDELIFELQVRKMIREAHRKVLRTRSSRHKTFGKLVKNLPDNLTPALENIILEYIESGDLKPEGIYAFLLHYDTNGSRDAINGMRLLAASAAAIPAVQQAAVDMVAAPREPSLLANVLEADENVVANVSRAIRDNDQEFISDRLKACITGDGTFSPDSLISLMRICSEQVESESLLNPVESAWPVLQSVTELTKEQETDFLRILIANENVFLKDKAYAVLFDRIMLMEAADRDGFERDIKKYLNNYLRNWVKRQAPLLEGSMIYYVAAENTFWVGGLGPVMTYHAKGMYELIKMANDMGIRCGFTTIEPKYMLRRDKLDASGNPTPLDYEHEGVKGLKKLMGYDVSVFNDDGSEEKIFCEVFVGQDSDTGMPKHFVKDVQRSGYRGVVEQDGDSFYTRMTYNYRETDYGKVNDEVSSKNPSWEESTGGINKPIARLIYDLEVKRHKEWGADFNPAIVHGNDGQNGPLHTLLASMYPDDPIVSGILSYETTHTIGNRRTRTEEDVKKYLRWLGIDKKYWSMFKRIGFWDWTSAAVRAGWANGVSKIHGGLMRHIDKGWTHLTGITNGTDLKLMAKYFHKALKEKYGKTVDLYRPSSEQIQVSKPVCKQYFNDSMMMTANGIELSITLNNLRGKTISEALASIADDVRADNTAVGILMNYDMINREKRLDDGIFNSIVREARNDGLEENLIKFRDKKISSVVDSLKVKGANDFKILSFLEKLQRDGVVDDEIINRAMIEIGGYANVDTEKITLGYYGRLVDEKTGLTTAFTYENIEQMLKDGVQILYFGNVQGFDESKATAKRLMLWESELNAKGYAGKFIFVDRAVQEQKLAMLAACDMGILPSTRDTGASEYTEVPFSANGALVISPVYPEGTIMAQGRPVDWKRPGRGNTVIAHSDTPNGYLDAIREAVSVWNDRRSDFYMHCATSVRFSRILDYMNTSASYLTEYQRILARQKKQRGEDEKAMAAIVNATKTGASKESIKKLLYDGSCFSFNGNGIAKPGLAGFIRRKIVIENGEAGIDSNIGLWSRHHLEDRKGEKSSFRWYVEYMFESNPGALAEVTRWFDTLRESRNDPQNTPVKVDRRFTEFMSGLVERLEGVLLDEGASYDRNLIGSVEGSVTASVANTILSNPHYTFDFNGFGISHGLEGFYELKQRIERNHGDVANDHHWNRHADNNLSDYGMFMNSLFQGRTCCDQLAAWFEQLEASDEPREFKNARFNSLIKDLIAMLRIKAEGGGSLITVQSIAGAIKDVEPAAVASVAAESVMPHKAVNNVAESVAEAFAGRSWLDKMGIHELAGKTVWSIGDADIDELKAYAAIGMNALHLAVLADGVDPEGIYLYDENITLENGETVTVPVYAKAEPADNGASAIRLQVRLPRGANRDAALRGAVLVIMNSMREGVMLKDGELTVKEKLGEMGLPYAGEINPDILQCNGFAGLISNEDIAKNHQLLAETIFEVRFRSSGDVERLSEDVFSKYDIVRAADNLKKREPLHRAENLIDFSGDVEESVKEAIWKDYLPLRKEKAGGEVKLPYGVAVYKNISQLRQVGRPQDLGEGKITDLVAFIIKMSEMNVDTVMLDNVFDKLVRYIDWSRVDGVDRRHVIVTEAAHMEENISERDERDAVKAHMAYKHSGYTGDLGAFLEETAKFQFKEVLRHSQVKDKVKVTFNVTVNDDANLGALEDKIDAWIKLGFSRVYLDLSARSTLPEQWIERLAGKLGKDTVGIIPSPLFARQAHGLADRLDIAFVDRVPYGTIAPSQVAGENVVRMMYIEEGKTVIAGDDVEEFKKNIEGFVDASKNVSVIAMPDLASGVAANDAQFRDLASGHASHNVYRDFIIELTSVRALRPKSIAEVGELACQKGYKVAPEKVNAAEFTWFDKSRDITLVDGNGQTVQTFSGRGLGAVLEAGRYIQQCNDDELAPLAAGLANGRLFDETLRMLGRLTDVVENRNWVALARQVELLKNRMPANASSADIVRSHVELFNLVRGAMEHVVEARYYEKNSALEKFVSEQDNRRFRAILLAAHVHGTFDDAVKTAKDSAMYKISGDIATSLNKREDISGSYFREIINVITGKSGSLSIEKARAAYEALPVTSGLKALVPMVLFVKAVASVRHADADNKAEYVLAEIRSIMQPQIDALQKTGTLPDIVGNQDKTAGWALAESARMFALAAERRVRKPAQAARDIILPALVETLRTQG
ncbi:MAG: hypothetical protein A2219_00840 [Elusimicrobia bacterium RIFOXYA2_FULL_50_26]|nr:MAG: hypothetical protein A2219_00840 [Elusimicrobia bacterium RIFOXYA2_FULL_50_26]